LLTADELREQLGALPKFLIDTRKTHHRHTSTPDVAWTGEAGSRCQSEIAAGIVGSAGPWGEKPFRHTAETCGLYLEAVCQHLRNLGLMFEAGGFSLSGEVVVRAAIETAMRVAWILDNRISPKARIARVYLDTYHSLREVLSAYSPLAPDVGRQIGNAKRTILRKDIPDLFAPSEISLADDVKSGEWTLAKEPYLSPEETAVLIANRSDMHEDMAADMSSFLSAYVHPNAVELERRFVPSEDGAGRGLGVNADYVRRLVASAVTAFYMAYRLQVAYLGWDAQALEVWEARAEEVLPESFADPEADGNR